MSRILTEGFEYGIPVYKLWDGTSYRGTEWEYYAFTAYPIYSQGDQGVVADARTGNFSVRFRSKRANNHITRSYATRPFLASNDIYGRIYFKVNGFTAGDADIIQILDSASNQLLKFRLLKASTCIGVYDQSNVLLGTLPPLAANEWVKLEFHIAVAISGTIEIWQNNAAALAYSGDTKGAKTDAAKLRIGANIDSSNLSGDFQITYDDIAINNTLGTFNNGRCGGGGVVGLKPTAAGTYTQFAPIGGTTNWGNLIDTPVANDASYNNSATPGNIDTFIFEKLADKGFTNADLINSVSVEVYSRYYLEPANHAMYLKGVSEHEFGNFASSTEYGLTSIVTDIDPDTTGDRLTVSKIDGMEFGYKHKVV